MNETMAEQGSHGAETGRTVIELTRAPGRRSPASRNIPAEAKRRVLRQYRHQRSYVGRDPFDAMETVMADHARYYADAALSGDSSDRAEEILDRYHAARWYFNERICTPFGEHLNDLHRARQTVRQLRGAATRIASVGLAASLENVAAQIERGSLTLT